MEPELVVHPIRWNLAPIASENHWARNWLSFQSNRGLAPNTLEAYVRGIEIYFAFLAKQGITIENATRIEIGAYINSLLSHRPQGLSNATVQQRITVVRLFYAYLVEEGVCRRNPALSHAPGVRSLIPKQLEVSNPLLADVLSIIFGQRAVFIVYDAAKRLRLARPWSDTEVNHLLWSIDSNASLALIAGRLGRTVAAVRKKLRDLGYSAESLGGYKVKEVADMFSVPPARVQYWVAEKLLLTKGGRITESSLSKFLADHPKRIPFETLSPEMQNWLREMGYPVEEDEANAVSVGSQ
jgi:hypothetical protein